MPKKIKVEEEKITEKTPLEIAEERLKMFQDLRVKLETEGINRMSGLDIKLRQAEEEVKRLK